MSDLEAKIKASGVVYLSRLPPFMKPTAVKEIFSRFGDVGRVFLAQEDGARARARKKLKKDTRVRFVEGWVEFLKKKEGRMAADMLNNNQLGGKKGYKFHDFTWNVKYLPKFKWTDLTDKIAHDKAVRDQKIRIEMNEANREQKFFVAKSGEKRALSAMQSKRKGRHDSTEGAHNKILRTFSQRKVHDAEGGDLSVSTSAVLSKSE